MNVAAVLPLRDVGTTVATAGATVVSVDSVDSVGVGSSTSCLAAVFAGGLRPIAAGLTGWSASFSAVSDPAGSASLMVAGVGCSGARGAGGSVSSAVLSSSSCRVASVSSGPLGSAAASFFGFSPEGFVFGFPTPPCPNPLCFQSVWSILRR